MVFFVGPFIKPSLDIKTNHGALILTIDCQAGIRGGGGRIELKVF